MVGLLVHLTVTTGYPVESAIYVPNNFHNLEILNKSSVAGSVISTEGRNPNIFEFKISRMRSK
jgi:hypothetical protein